MKSLLLIVLITVLTGISSRLFARSGAGHSDSVRQYLLIVRSNPHMPAPAAEAVQSNEQHWGQFIGELAQGGKLVTGFRPATGGMTISGSAKIAKDGVYSADKEVVSSIFVIRAASLAEASEIAKKCPIYEMAGSVEIRPVAEGR
jgi:hypothetical protein